jgi:hypothetical protein
MKKDLFISLYPSGSAFGGFLDGVNLDNALIKFTGARELVNPGERGSTPDTIAKNAVNYFKALNNTLL